MVPNLPNEIWDYIFILSNINCHVCNQKINFNNNFYKKQGNFYYCSKQCYTFI